MRAELTGRRKRSKMSRGQATYAVAQFASRLYRFAETSEDMKTLSPLPRGNINVVIQVEGSFGVSDDFFEALRVLGGWKIPRKTPK